MATVIGKITGLSISVPVISPDAAKFLSGYPTGMDLKGILTRIERRLKVVGLSAHAASEAAGKPDAIRNLRRAVESNDPKRKGINASTLLELAPVLKTTFVWLLDELGPEESDDTVNGHATIYAPLVSMVQAGTIRKPEHVEQFEDAKTVSAPGLDPKGEWIALTVEGDSMDRISPPGSIIFVDVRDRKIVPNACYVIQDEDGGASYKRYRPDPPRWEPVSENREHETYFVKGGRGPRIIGRVKKTLLDM